MTTPKMKPTTDMEYRPEKVTREFRPSVRLKERKETLRQKLRIIDLLPNRNYIKDVSDRELRYFLILSLPIVVTAFVTAMKREELIGKLIAYLVSFLQSS